MGISSARSRLGATLIVVASISRALLGNGHAQGSLDLSSDLSESESPKKSASILRLLCQTNYCSEVVYKNGRANEGSFGNENLTVEVNRFALTIIVYGTYSDGRS